MVVWLWELVHAMDSEHQRAFLHYVTGSGRVPIKGTMTSTSCGPVFFARFNQRRSYSAVSCELCCALIGARSALLCPNWAFRAEHAQDGDPAERRAL